MGLLIEAYVEAKNSQRYQKVDGSVNVHAVADELSDRAKNLGISREGSSSGQSAEAIKSRIEEALASKRQKQPAR